VNVSGRKSCGVDRLGAVYHQLAVLIQPEVQVSQGLGGWPGLYLAVGVEMAAVAGADEPTVLFPLYQTAQVWADGVHGIQALRVVADIGACLRDVDQRAGRIVGQWADGDDGSVQARRSKGEKADGLANDEDGCRSQGATGQPGQEAAAVQLAPLPVGASAILFLRR
jgi:hypothetical protein